MAPTSFPAFDISQAPSAMRKNGERPSVTLRMNLNASTHASVSSCEERVACVRKNRPNENDDIKN